MVPRRLWHVLTNVGQVLEHDMRTVVFDGFGHDFVSDTMRGCHTTVLIPVLRFLDSLSVGQAVTDAATACRKCVETRFLNIESGFSRAVSPAPQKRRYSDASVGGRIDH